MPFTQRVADVMAGATLRDVSSRLGAARELAVDVEADSMHHFLARLCFVQLGTDDDIFLLDTLEPEVEPKVLVPVFADPQVVKVFHAAQGDLQYLAEAGVRVANLFDTHRAATLLGWPKVGLADLVKEKLGHTLQKEHQQADFSKRPLPPELRAYIADDVRYLVEVGRIVRAACVEAGILEEVELDCRRLADDAAERPDVASSFRPKLPKQGLSATQVRMAHVIARALHLRRLAWAQKADVPMGRMLSNMGLTAVATRFPSTLKELTRCEGVRGALAREHGEEILTLVRETIEQGRAGALPPEAQEQPRDPRQRKREEQLLSWRKEEATKRKVTPSVVLSNGLVEDLARLAPRNRTELAQVPYFGSGRLDRYADQLLALLESLS